MRKVLGQDFFNRSALVVARELLGKFLVRRIGNKDIALPIAETEAYFGFKDEGSHAFKGKTKRNEVMFGPAGYFYIYLIYGMYEMLNLVTSGQGYPAGVLIRGVEGISGPGRVTKHFKITRELYGQEISPKSGLWVEDRGVNISMQKIKITPRIGISYASDFWQKKRYRFVLLPEKGSLKK